MPLILGAGLLPALGAACVGCGGASDPPPTPAASKPAVTLRVGVVGDKSLANAIARLAGEWNTRSGGTLRATTVDTLSEASLASLDAVVFSSAALGELCERHALRPLRRSMLESDEFALGDLFPLVREVEIVYGRRPMAAPLGCPCPLVFSAATPIDRYDLKAFSDLQHGLAFLALAAPRVVHRSQAGVLWESDTFEPQLESRPFVRTLEQLIADANDSEDAATTGRVVWPNRGSDSEPGGAAPVTATAEVYNPLSGVWEPSPAQPATLVASSGRLVGVTTASRNATSAFRLVAWLASAEVASQLRDASPGLANCRGSLATRPDDWIAADPRAPRAASFSRALAAALRTNRFLIAPRLPGHERYVATLGAAVGRALGGEATASAALAEAAADWRRIADELGRQQQHAAYLRSINLRAYEPQRP
ncbi:MAG: hypothetical protein AAFV43_15680 [Planctomycetota bacterium]